MLIAESKYHSCVTQDDLLKHHSFCQILLWSYHMPVTLTTLFLFQASQVLELALHLEKTVINLKIDALRMWNVVLVGTACGNLLTLIDNAYGYPESRQSIKHGQYLETVEWEFAENEPNAEPAKGLTSKEATTAEATFQPPPAKRRKQLPQADKCKLQLAGAVIPTWAIS